MDLRDSDDPSWKKSKTDTRAPRRTQLLSDKALPSWAISITDRENKDPSLATPTSDKVAPLRAKLLIAREAPN
jgi:hypothetical protein